MSRKKNTTVCSITFFFFPVSLFFSCLEKQNKQALTDDPLLPIYSLSVCQPEPCFFSEFMRVCKWRCVSFNHRVSHVTRAEGSKGTQGGGGGGGGSTTTDEGGSPHLPPSAVRASSSLHNGNSPIGFSFFLFINWNMVIPHLHTCQQVRYQNCFRCLENPPYGKIHMYI